MTAISQSIWKPNRRHLATLLSFVAFLGGCVNEASDPGIGGKDEKPIDPKISGVHDEPRDSNRSWLREAYPVFANPYPDEVPAGVLEDNCISIRNRETSWTILNGTFRLTWSSTIPGADDLVLVLRAHEGETRIASEGGGSPQVLNITEPMQVDAGSSVAVGLVQAAQRTPEPLEATLHVELAYSGDSDLVIRTGYCSNM